MSTIKEKFIGLATPNYLGEQLSEIQHTMEGNIKYLINECSATSQVSFPEDYDTPQLFNENNKPFYLGIVALEGNDIVVYDNYDECTGEFIYLNHDTQLAIYEAVYNFISDSTND